MSKATQYQSVLLIFSSNITGYFKNKKSTSDESYYVSVPTAADKKLVLDHVPYPNFEEYHYIPFESFGEIKKKFIKTDFPFVRQRRQSCSIVVIDKNKREIIGTRKEPYKLYEPPEKYGAYFSTNGEIIPYVCYHSNGEVIVPAIEGVIKELPERASEESVLLVFQWKHENPTRTGYYVTPRLVTVAKLSEHLKGK